MVYMLVRRYMICVSDTMVYMLLAHRTKAGEGGKGSNNNVQHNRQSVKNGLRCQRREIFFYFDILDSANILW